MSDQHDEELIRSALHADAAGVTADDALLDRITAATTRRRPASRRLAPWLVIAAALAVLAGSAGVLAGRDNDQTVDLVDDPRTTTPIDIDDVSPSPAESCAASDGGRKVLLVFMSATATATEIAETRSRLETAQDAGDTAIDSVRYVDRAEAFEAAQQRRAGSNPELDSLTLERTPTYFVVTMPPGTDDVELRSQVADFSGVLGTTSIDCAGLGTSTADRPAHIVAVTQQGHVVVVDSSTGEVIRDLGGFDDPTDQAVADREGGAYSITDVALHPNGRDVYFETCCEPAAGAIYRVPIDGSVPIDPNELQPISFGFGIDISADGRWLAFAHPYGVTLRDLESDEEVSTEGGDEGFIELARVAVNRDGTEITAERALEYEDTGPFHIVRSELLTFRRVGGSLEHSGTSGGDVRLLPVYSAGGTELTTVTARDGLIDLNVDATGQWFLATSFERPLRSYSEAADEREIPGSYVAADW